MDNNLILNKSIERLSGGLAHDLNNIIMVLQGFTDCLRKSSRLDEKQIKFIDQIEKATAQTGEITDILLTICQRSVLNMSYFNLHEMLEMFIKGKQSQGDSLHILDLKSEIDDSSIYFDRGRMLTVLENLYKNSIYPNEESRYISYTLTTSILSEADITGNMIPGTYIVLDIYDDGPGIDKDIGNEIFDPYFSTKPRGKGKGLGLAVCAGIIGQCDSFIYNNRHIKKGCLISILIPQIPKGSTKESTTTILLIDKDEIIRELFKQTLITAGYTVYCTSSVEEGLDIALSFPIDILVTEFLLPESNGYDILQKIQNTGENLSIIFLTSYSHEKNEINGIENSRFLQKPIKPSFLIKEIQNMGKGR